MDKPEMKNCKDATILPHDEHFGRWLRAKVRARELIDGFKQWCSEGNATLPASWNPEAEFTQVIAETEKAINDQKKNHDNGN
jgi:hypothetical protein